MRGDFFHILYVGLDHFWGVQILEFQYFGGFQKNKYEDFLDIFGVMTKLDWALVGISMHFRVFS